MYETLTVESDARGVATVTLNRPDKHNVLNAQMIAELTSVAKVLGDDTGVRVVVLTGAGQSFWGHKRGNLDPPKPGFAKAVHQCDLLGRRDHPRFVLQSIARADLKNLDEFTHDAPLPLLLGKNTGNPAGSTVPRWIKISVVQQLSPFWWQRRAKAIPIRDPVVPIRQPRKRI